jgi:small conductance mechanosensitive channel
MNIRTTNLRTFQGQIVLIPNKEVYQNPIVNYTETGERRIDLSVGVSYGDDLEKARKVAIEAVKGIPNLREDKGITFYYDEFKDSSINFNIRLWVDYKGDNRYYLQVKNDGIMRIKKAFEENDISIPFPIRTLDFGIKGGEKLNEVIDVKSFSDGGNN